ncbi:MAG: DNA polymerase I, partial [Rickettsiaceae bacterium]|nr:DNA polymerase I [Rickettsiaceae bacterium]
SQGRKCVIVSSDKDLLQLMSDNIAFYDAMKAKYITPQDVMDKFGVAPDKVRDALALIGDSSDNIPGVPSIGPKTAADLLRQFGSFHEVINRSSEIQQTKRREAIESSKDKALLSWELVGLKMDLDVTLEKTSWTMPKREDLIKFISEYGFKSLLSRAEKLFGMDLETAPKQQTLEKKSTVAQVVEFANSSGFMSIYLESEELIISSGDASSNIEFKDCAQLLDIFRDRSVKKITTNLKNLIKIVSKYGIRDEDFISFEDLSLMNYVLSAGVAQPPEDFWIKGGVSFVDKYEELKNKLYENNAMGLYNDIDLPLSFILAKMEKAGILVDKDILQKMSGEFAIEIDILEKKIFEICGVEFNVASPKQLGEILFEKMKLPAGKMSSKSKTFSTGIEILEHLSEAGYEIADHLIRWRMITKLKNTYTDALQNQINADTGRIHTHFIQNGTSTGRLSSHEPNLQNIPIRTADGAKIREAFIAKPGYLLLSADYSQVELRIVAAIANIEPMKEAFKRGDDIHAITASGVFKMPVEMVTKDMRRKAKAINFGIIYGISAFGLAKQLGITSKEAAKYIENYFQEYPGIEKYMADTKAFAHKMHYVENVFKRKCNLPHISDSNYATRSFIERAAINAPIQSSAADIAKMAMIAVDKALSNSAIDATMLLQVHDELIFEVKEEDVAVVSKIIKNAMENVVKLDVPMVVDVSISKNWARA